MSVTYVLPQVEVFQDFQLSPAAVAQPLQAHISGPDAQLVRYNQPTEQALGLLGTYDALDDAYYDWPNRAAGGLIDSSYVKLYAKNAILRYFSASAGSDAAVTVTSSNKVRSASTNWQTSGDYAQDASLLDRGAKIGDTVMLRFVPGMGSPVTLWSYISGFASEAVASSLGSPTADSSNGGTTGSSVSYSQTQGPWNAVRISAASATGYNPYSTGRISETYTIVVTGSSVDGDFTKATLRVISASGLDNQASVTPNHPLQATAIGTLGLTVTFRTDNSGEGGVAESESAEEQGVSPDDLLVGQKWVVHVTASFTAVAAPTASGTYTGPADTTYILTVTKGAKYAGGVPQLTVTTTTGVDMSSAPVNVPSAGSAVSIGSYGVRATFAGAGLNLGDRFYLPVVAAGQGRVSTIILGNTIPSSIPNATPADITLYIKNPNLQISQDRTGEAPLVNYSSGSVQLTVYSGITAFDPSWTDGGVPVALPLDSDTGNGFSTLYVEYRAWLSTLCNSVNSINSVANLNSAFTGSLDPDNPLKWGVFKALTNSNGSNVLYSAVCNPDSTDSWASTLALLNGYNGVYGLVPLTRNTAVWDLYQAFVTDQSSAENGQWSVAWFNLGDVSSVPIVSAGSAVAGYTAATTSDGDPALATISQDPDSEATAYTIVTVPAANGIFITNNVQPGDIVRAFFSNDGFGNATYQEYVVDVVITQEQLRLLAGPASPVSVASKIEIWRNLSATEQATAIAKVAGAFGSRRIRAVWPDTIDDGGTTMEGYHLCAALAGLRSGVLPQQGMTNLAVAGFDNVPRTTKLFNAAQLNIMAGSGVWIVTQSPAGEIYTRHALTTGTYDDINQREEIVTSNVDSISYQFAQMFAPYIGIANVTPTLIEVLRVQILTLIQQLASPSTTNPLLGGQLGANTQIVALRQHLTLKDRIVLILNLDLPYPFDTFEVHLVVPAAPAVATTTAVPTSVASTATTTG